jgi:hypothetical protein
VRDLPREATGAIETVLYRIGNLGSRVAADPAPELTDLRGARPTWQRSHMPVSAQSRVSLRG